MLPDHNAVHWHWSSGSEAFAEMTDGDGESSDQLNLSDGHPTPVRSEGFVRIRKTGRKPAICGECGLSKRSDDIKSAHALSTIQLLV